MSATLSPAEADAVVKARERFGVRLGLERIRRVLAELDNPERRYPSIHVVGTNGKSTAARQVEALLEAAGSLTGTYLSPHVVSLSERFRVGGAELDVAAVIGPVLAAVDAVDSAAAEPVTQFELLTVAALNAFAAHNVDVAVVEAGLGGRYDATNVLGADVVVLTNIALEHEAQLGATRAAIAEEKLAVLSPGATLILGEPEWEARARELGATRVVCATDSDGLAVAAAEAHLGEAVDQRVAGAVGDPRLPGRCELVAEHPRELWDGAHNPHAVAWLAQELSGHEHVLVLSVLDDKAVEPMLQAFAELGRVLVATRSTNPRSLTATELADRARGLRCFDHVEALEDAVLARNRGRELASAAGKPLLVSGSLYLLQDLSALRGDLIAVRPGPLP